MRKSPAFYVVLILISIIFIPASISYSGIDIKAYQGTTVVIRSEKPKKEIIVCVFGKYFTPVNGNIYVIGIDIDQKPGNYPVMFCDPESKEQIGRMPVEILVIRKNYSYSRVRTRTGRYTGKKLEQRIKEIELMNKAFNEGLSFRINLEDKFTEPFVKIEITGGFGVRRKYNNGTSIHRGIDLRAKTGTLVAAINKGKVIIANRFLSEGNMIVINHGSGIMSVYMHLKRILVEEGDEVSPGMMIAESGDTGNSRGPHLHFGIKINGSYVEPVNFIKNINRHIN